MIQIKQRCHYGGLLRQFILQKHNEANKVTACLTSSFEGVFTVYHDGRLEGWQVGLHYSRRTERPVYTDGPTSNHFGWVTEGGVDLSSGPDLLCGSLQPPAVWSYALCHSPSIWTAVRGYLFCVFREIPSRHHVALVRPGCFYVDHSRSCYLRCCRPAGGPGWTRGRWHLSSSRLLSTAVSRDNLTLINWYSDVGYLYHASISAATVKSDTTRPIIAQSTDCYCAQNQDPVNPAEEVLVLTASAC